MPTLIVTVDLECYRCSAKIHKVLNSVQDRGEFAVEKVVYEEDKDRVLVSGPFDADKLCCKLRCKAGTVIKNIEVAKPPQAKPKPDVKPQPKPKPEPEPSPCNIVPYAYPYPYPYPQYPSTSPCSCATPYCHCYSSKPPPPPAPARQPACQCPTWPHCRCFSYPPYQVPPPCTPLIVCEESPTYGACAIM